MISLEQSVESVLDLLMKKDSSENSKESLAQDSLEVLSLCISSVIGSTYSTNNYEDAVNEVFGQVKEDLGICVKSTQNDI